MEKPFRETAIQHGTRDFNFSIYPLYNGGDKPPYFPDHWHPEYEITYVKNGLVNLEIDGKPYQLHSNQALIANRFQIHSCRGVSDSSFYFTNIVFGAPFLFPDPSSLIYSRYIHPPKGELQLQSAILGIHEWEKQVLQILQELCLTAERHRPGYELQLQIQLLTIFSIMIDAKAYNFFRDSYSTLRSQIQEILYYMQTNYQQDIKIFALASEMHMSTEHFIRSFKKITGKSPKKYLLDYRLQRAASQLVESEDSITSIAESCGFYDMSYFSRFFKSQMGKTPKEYREDSIGSIAPPQKAGH